VERHQAQDSLNIGADARCLNVRHLRGMGKYFGCVVGLTSKVPGVGWRLFADRPDWPLHVPDGENIVAEVFELRGYRFRGWEQIGLPRRIRKARVDVLHCPASTAPLWQPVPVVVTIHDTLPWTRGEHTDEPFWYLKLLVPLAFRRCAAVITISESSKKDILLRWPRLAGKLYVIPHGVEQAYLAAQPYGLPRSLKDIGVCPPYLLYIGGTLPRKRLDWAIRVIERLGDKRLQLVICGVEEQQWPAILAGSAQSVRNQLFRLPFVAEAHMPALYQHAIAVLYPTLYEGFGLPVLESHAVGTPVLFSDVGSLRELIGPAAYVMPIDAIDQWVDCCRQLVNQRVEGPRPIEAARRWAARFSWENSASKHLEVYRLAAAKSRKTTATPH